MENKLLVKSYEGSESASHPLHPIIFGREWNAELLKEVLHHQRNKRRSATYGTQDRGEVSYGGRKRRPQKGTGQARMGCYGAPHHKGGAVAFGPDGRKYDTQMNKKKKRAALLMVLTQKYREGNLLVVESLNLQDKPNTKHMIQFMKNHDLKNSLFVCEKSNDILRRSVGNLVKAGFLALEGINPLCLLKRREIVITQAALQKLEEMLRGKENE